MKRSLYWRFGIILFVLIAWTVSLFPIRDRDFLATFEKLADPKAADYRDQAAEAEAEAARLQDRLATLGQEAGEKYRALRAEYEQAQSNAKLYQRYVLDYEGLLAEAQQLLAADNDVRAPYRALKLAAQGSESELPVQLSRYVSVPTIPNASNSLVLSRVRNLAAGKLHLGLDLQGGTEFVIGFDATALPDRRTEDVRDQIVEILRNRVDRLGVVEPEIKPIGPASISLRMPSVSEDDKADVRRTIKQTAKLEFRLVHPNNDQLVRALEADPATFKPEAGYGLHIMETEQADGSIVTEKLFLTNRPARVKGRHVTRAFASVNEFNNYYVSLAFDAQGATEFATLTTEHVGKRLAIVLDEKVYSAPLIREPITGGQAQITGNFGPEEARRLAGVIESGNLPVSINIDSEFGTDPTLGKDSIRSGMMAAILGLALVVIFMIFYYRLPGVIAVLALLANILLVFGTLALSRATITLPGIAGIVLTIGMAVDANVLIFERIREEIGNGKSIANAIRAGYRRAFVTILDANLTTLITAIILFRVGTGPIRGFAVTLSIGIIASMFTALFMTRAIFDLLHHSGRLQKLTMLSLVRDPRFDFLKFRKLAFAASILLVLLAIGVTMVRGRNVLSIDFSGGTAAVFRVDGEVLPAVAEVRGVVESQGVTNAAVGYKYSAAGEGRMLEIVLPQRSTNESSLNLENITAALNNRFSGAVFEHAQTNSVGSLVGQRFQTKAVMAVVLASIAIIIYISFRFEFAYAIASMVALLHDVVIAAGIYMLCGRQLSLPVVAALLTIMGYSLNDTIVVFDRIREDLGLLKSRSYREIINLSINQTLSRTLLTSWTTLLVVIILFIFGGGAINDFALVMLVGIIVGTYSSIFVASAIVATWHKPTHAERAAAGSVAAANQP
jgi:SecD/SecF fusion protein